MHISETVYFTVIFVLQSIHELADFARSTANRHIYMVVETLACWMDAIVHHYLDQSTGFRGRYDMDLLKINIALRSLALVYVLMKYCCGLLCYVSEVDSSYNYRDDGTGHMLLPESYIAYRDLGVSDKAALPRRYRDATEWSEEAAPIQSLIEAAKLRTRRLLRSFDELQREVWESASPALPRKPS